MSQTDTRALIAELRRIAYAAGDEFPPNDAFLVQDEGGRRGQVIVQEVEHAVLLRHPLGGVVQDGEGDP